MEPKVMKVIMEMFLVNLKGKMRCIFGYDLITWQRFDKRVNELCEI